MGKFDEEGVLALMDKSESEMDNLVYASGRGGSNERKALRLIENVLEAKRRKKSLSGDQ